MRTRLFALALALLAVLLASVVITAHAAGITLCNLCTNFTISKRGDGAVLIRCPGRAAPLFVMQNCARPVVTRTLTSTTIECR